MELVDVLEMTVSTDQNQLTSAQQFLEQALKDNLLGVLQQLSAILQDVSKSSVARMQAGLQLKNGLYSKDPTIFEHYRNRWRTFDEQARNYIKTNVVCSLGTEQLRPSSAAQCVAYIACAELPHGMWPDIIDVLSSHVTTASNTSMMREAALEAISYICQDIDPDVIQAKSNQILTAIVHGMKKEEPSREVKLAATNALLNSLEFTKANFDKESERNFIMTVVCEASQLTDLQIKVAALQCLVKIMSLYYSYMEPYMGPALFAITIAAIKSDTDEVALQGIEFWSNVCDEELDLAIEASEAAETARPPERNSMFYAKGALQFLVPLLCNRLAKQEEFDDDDEWNPCKAAGVCLMLMATCCENDIVPHVLPFVNKHITCTDWKYRDAAVMAFGSVLEGPDPDDLKQVVEQALPTLIAMFKDSSVVVRDTVAWTVGRVCELMQDIVIKKTYLPTLLEALEAGLWEEPRVATNICWALSSLAEAAYEAAEALCEGVEPETFALSEKFPLLIERLLQTTDRPDCNHHNLRSAAYEALMELVKNSPKDCYEVVKRTTVIILQRLERVLGIEDSVSSTSDRAQVNDLQSLLCATLQSVLRKMSPEDAPQISDNIMVALMHMFESSARGGAGGVQEDALLAVSTLVEVLGDKFTKYMEAFKPYLAMGLKNTAEYTVCLAAVGIVGDLCRALGSNVHVYCEDIMGLLIENLSNNSVHRAIKPQILSTFGDLALAIGPAFQNYLAVILTILQQASQLQVDKNDYDMVDYLNELWEGCLEAYTGIVQGLKGDGEVPAADVQLLWPHIPYMVSFVEHVGMDDDHSDANVAACCGLIGDLLAAFGDKMVHLVDKESIANLLTKGRRSKVNKTKTLATWATKEIRKLKIASSTTS